MSNDKDLGETVVTPDAGSDLEVLRQHLAPKYKVEDKLGSGGMADVYLGFHNLLKRKVAIKVLPKMFARDEGMVQRFLQEAESAAQLEHPHIISIYDIGVAAHLNYFIMAYVPGGTLKGMLRKKKSLEHKAACRIISQICSALQYAHDKGVVHRDIKPDNIMFDERGSAILTDFGIAKAKFASKMTATGTLIGTPHYMSPEQLKGQGVDGRSDIYSLGIMFYEILTGHVPFEGSDTYAVGLKHIQEAPVPPIKVNSKIPAPLNDLILTMLAKTPDARFQSAAEVEQAIAAVLGGHEAPNAYASQAEKAVETWRLQRTQVQEDFERMKDTLGEAAPGVTPPPLGEVEEKITAAGTVVRTDTPRPSPPPVAGVEERITGGGEALPAGRKSSMLPLLLGIGGAAVALVVVIIVVVLALSGGGGTSSDRSRSRDRGSASTDQPSDRGDSGTEDSGDGRSSTSIPAALTEVFDNYDLIYVDGQPGSFAVKFIDEPLGDTETILSDLGNGSNSYAVEISANVMTEEVLAEWSDGNLYRINVYKPSPEAVYTDPQGTRAGRKYPAWGPNGQYATFVRRQDNVGYLYAVQGDMADWSQIQPAFQYQGYMFCSAFSPTELKVALAVSANPNGAPSNLLLIDFDAQSWDNLVENPGKVEGIHWSITGEQFVYAVTGAGKNTIKIFDTSSRNETEVTSGKGDSYPVFSPEGDYIIFSSQRNGGWALWAVPYSGGRAVQVTKESSGGIIKALAWE